MGLHEITWITWITWITKITEDYRRLHRITRDYMRLHEITCYTRLDARPTSGQRGRLRVRPRVQLLYSWDSARLHTLDPRRTVHLTLACGAYGSALRASTSWHFPTAAGTADAPRRLHTPTAPSGVLRVSSSGGFRPGTALRREASSACRRLSFVARPWGVYGVRIGI